MCRPSSQSQPGAVSLCVLCVAGSCWSPGGALSAHAWGLLGRVQRAAPHPPSALTLHTKAPAFTLPGRGTHAQGNLRAMCEDSTQPRHPPDHARLLCQASWVPRPWARLGVLVPHLLLALRGDFPRGQGQGVQAGQRAAAVTAACALELVHPALGWPLDPTHSQATDAWNLPGFSCGASGARASPSIHRRNSVPFEGL